MTAVQWGLVVAGVLTLGVVVGALAVAMGPSFGVKKSDGALPDWLAIGVSLVALGTSIATVFIERAQQDRALRITTRDQLTAITLKLIDTRQELAEFEGEYLKKQDQGVADYGEYDREAGILNQKLTSLARQALELMRTDTDIGFDVEFIAIGDALMVGGDFPAANEAYRKAVMRSPNERYESINLAIQAEALFEQGDELGGREIYRESLTRPPQDTDINRVTHLQTYRKWLIDELEASQGASAASEAVREAGLSLVAKLQGPSFKASWARTFLPTPPASTSLKARGEDRSGRSRRRARPNPQLDL